MEIAEFRRLWFDTDWTGTAPFSDEEFSWLLEQAERGKMADLDELKQRVATAKKYDSGGVVSNVPITWAELDALLSQAREYQRIKAGMPDDVGEVVHSLRNFGSARGERQPPLLSEAADALTALSARVGGLAWQSIETAPFQKMVLLSQEGTRLVVSAYRHGQNAGWRHAHSSEVICFEPTHWQPHPKPPKAKPSPSPALTEPVQGPFVADDLPGGEDGK